MGTAVEEKCQVVNFAGKHNAIAFNYKLDGEILATITSFQYLGVQITKNFSWDMHVDSITSTASQKLGMIKREKLRMVNSADPF